MHSIAGAVWERGDAYPTGRDRMHRRCRSNPTQYEANNGAENEEISHQ